MTHVLTIVAVVAPREGGGNAERAVQLTRAFARLGLRSTLLTLAIGDWQARIAQVDAGRVIAVPCLMTRFQIPSLRWSMLRKLVREADIIHMVGYWSLLQVLIAFIAYIENVPWVICPAGALPMFGRSKFFKHLFNAFFGYRLVRRAAGWIAITRDEVADFVDYGVHADNVEIIPNGVDADGLPVTTGLNFRAQFGLPAQPFILFMGRLNPIKGPDLLLEAFITITDNYADVHLVFAGPDGGMQDGLTARAQKAGVRERVHFIGFVSGANKSQAYREAMILAVPSRSEAMSIVAVEAGLCGTPILMTDRCGLHELDEVDKHLTVPATAQGLAFGLNYAFTDQQRLAVKGQQWQAIVLERFLWKNIAAHMANWLTIIVSTRQSFMR